MMKKDEKRDMQSIIPLWNGRVVQLYMGCCMPLLVEEPVWLYVYHKFFLHLSQVVNYVGTQVVVSLAMWMQTERQRLTSVDGHMPKSSRK